MTLQRGHSADVSLRPGVPEDVPVLAEILVAACRGGYAGYVPASVLDSLDPAKFARHLREWGRTVVAVDAGGRPLGYTHFGPQEDGGVVSGFIASLYVRPGAWGGGIGSALLGAALERLRAEGLQEAWLWVLEENHGARRLYERSGFAPTGVGRVAPDWQAPALRYARPLGPREVLAVTSPTEERNPRTADIDRLGTLALLERINDEDARVAGAVRGALPAMAELVEAALAGLARGGRVHYFGAGSSGRMALLDAAELPPTYGVAPELFVAHLAGGDAAVRRSREGAEDDEGEGAREAAASVGAGDVVIGIAASGYTRYVGGALRAAREAGAHTGLITSNGAAPLAALADTVVLTETGAEAITGSTRMKAATAQKLVLNSFSTAVMVRSGRTWSNLMVDVLPTNAKLRGRVVRLLAQATGAEERACEEALAAAGNETKTALVMLLAGTTAGAARTALREAGGSVAQALRAQGSA